MGRDAAIFGLGAAVAGAALGLLLDRGQDPYYSPGDDFLMGAVVLAVPGMGLGALVGALRNPGSFWARVPPDELEVALRAGDAERVRD